MLVWVGAEPFAVHEIRQLAMSAQEKWLGHVIDASVTHMCEALHVACGVSLSFEHMGFEPHAPFVGTKPHAPAPSHVPELQSLPLVAHTPLGLLPAAAESQTPSGLAPPFSAAKQETHAPEHAVSQHTLLVPPTQCIDEQSPSPVQGAPFAVPPPVADEVVATDEELVTLVVEDEALVEDAPEVPEVALDVADVLVVDDEPDVDALVEPVAGAPPDEALDVLPPKPATL